MKTKIFKNHTQLQVVKLQKLEYKKENFEINKKKGNLPAAK